MKPKVVSESASLIQRIVLRDMILTTLALYDKVGGNINLTDNVHQKIWIGTATDV